MAARLILLLKSAPGAGAKIAHQAGYAFYGNPGRWHKITAAKPAPKGAPVAHHPEAAGQHVPAAHFTDEQWAALKLPDTNVNAPAYNKALDKLKEWSDSGNVTAIVGAGYGTNTYGQKLAKIANHLLALYGSQHKVTSGQKAGTHAATQAPAQDDAPQDAAGPYAKLSDQLKAVLSSDMHAKVDAFVAALNSGADEQEAFDAADFGMQAVAAQKVLAAKHGMHVVAKAPAQFQPEAKHPKLHSSGISSFMVMDGHNVKIAHVDESEGGGYALFIDDKYKGHFGTATAAQGEAHQTIYGEEAKPAAAPPPNAAPAKAAADGPLKMPEFKEGKSSTVIKALYENVGQKIIDHAHAGNVSVLEGIPAPHKKMWMGKTANSKKLLALYAAAMAYAKGGAKPDAAPGKPQLVSGMDEAVALEKQIKPGKAEAVDEINNALFSNYNGKFVVKDANGKVAAAIAFGVNEAPGGDSIEVHHIGSVDKGSGSKLLDLAKEEAKKQGLPIKLYATKDAIGFYEKQGFTHVGAATTSDGGSLMQWSDAPAKKDDPIAGWKAAIAAGKTPTKAQAEAMDALEESDPDAHMEAFMTAAIDSIPADKNNDADYDAALEAAHEEAHQLHADALAGGHDAPATIDDGPKEGDTKPAADGGTLVLKDGHWVKQGGDEAPAAVPPATLGNLSAQHLQNLQSIPWYKLKLPDSNTNAATVNKKLQAIQDAAFAGNVAQLHAMKFGSNTYGKKLALLAQTAIAALGGNATAAVPVEPAPAAAAAPAPAPTQETAKKPRITADTPLTEGQQQAVDGLGKEALEALAEDGQPLPANVKAAIKKKLAEMKAAQAPKPAAPKTATAVKTTLHNTTAGHNKSWSVHVAPNASGGFDLVTEYGKIGKSQQKSAKPFPTEAAAHAAKLKLINEKKAKGYVLKDTDYGHKVVVPEPQKPAMPTPPAGVDKSNVWMKWVTGSIEAGATDSLDGYISALKNSDDPDAPAILKYAQQGMEYLTGEKAPDDGPKEGDTKQGADGLLVLKNGHWVKMGEGDPSAVEWDYDPSDMAMSGAATLTAEGDNGATFYIAYDGDSFQVGKMDPGGDVSDDYQDFAFLSDALIYMKDNLGGSVPSLESLQKLDKNFKASDLPGAKSAAAPSAAPASSGALDPMDSWTQTGGQGGSNPGGKFKDASGQEWYVKWPDDAEAVKSEVLAAKLYALAGLSSQDAKLVTKGGKIAIASKWVNIKKAASGADLAKVPGALEGFAVDAWLGNWDVVGLSLDNLQIGPDGKAHRVDAGGSLEYRAQGEKKPFGAKVEEIDTLRDAKKNPKAASVFGKMTDADIKASVAKVAAISDIAIRAMVNQYGPGDAAAKAKLAETLIARKQYLLKKYPQAAKTKKKPVFKPEEISAPPSFLNWGGTGKSGPSSKAFLNKANEDAVQAIFAAAKTGDAEAIKKLTAPVYNKETGAVTGHQPVLSHPSQHVKGYAQQVINEINYQLNPPKKFRFDGGHPLHALNAAYPAHKGEKSSQTAQKLGKFLVLGEPGTLKLEEVGLPPKIKHAEGGGTLSAHTYAAAAKAAFSKMPKTQKQAVQSYTGSSYHEMNGSLWSGNPSGAAKAASEALKTLGHDIAPGTVLSRKISVHGSDLDALLGATGKILEEPAIISTSIRPSSWSGNVHLKLHIGPGVKGLWVGHGSLPEGGAASKHSGEDEMILPPNTRLLIMSSKKGGMKDEDGFGGSRSHVIECLVLPTQ